LYLKNNKGSEDNRVRKLDYSIQLSKLFYERFINDEDITLFHHTKYLNYTKLGEHQSLMNLYKTAERKTSVKKKKNISTRIIF
jgi:ribonucleoside-diphosphate reductase alpha chain